MYIIHGRSAKPDTPETRERRRQFLLKMYGGSNDILRDWGFSDEEISRINKDRPEVKFEKAREELQEKDDAGAIAIGMAVAGIIVGLVVAILL